jgi:hypothetical protein
MRDSGAPAEPTNLIGYAVYSAAQLKTMQEIITLHARLTKPKDSRCTQASALVR